MPADLTLPGDLPGLLRRGSPVVDRLNRSGVVVELDPMGGAYASVAWAMPNDTDPDCYHPNEGLALDLADPTGAAHAAWWARSRYVPDLDDPHQEYLDTVKLLGDASSGFVTDDQRGALRDLCLRLAAEVARG
jgi:hypothetical protein